MFSTTVYARRDCPRRSLSSVGGFRKSSGSLTREGLATAWRRESWLGGRDSNPDSQIQSLESYHWTTSQQECRIYGARHSLSTEANLYPVWPKK